MSSKSAPTRYRVFISHAGEDKATIAIPLREKLGEQGITAFVDEKDIGTGGNAADEMLSAMEKADVAVIVLSPEFVAKKWSMKELLFFLNRRESAQANGESPLVIIPVFYRLSVADMYKEPRLERIGADGNSLYGTTRFFERRDNGDPEAKVDIIKGALQSLHGIMGVENKYRACNEESSAPSRLLLLKDICAKTSEVMKEYLRETFVGGKEEKSSASGSVDEFQQHFHDEPRRDVVLDFTSVDANGKALTHEGHIKRQILRYEKDSDQVLAILGGGGVGKSTILKGLVNDEDLQNRFRDGIHLISLGMDATTGTLFEELCRVLHDSGAVNAEERLRMKIRARLCSEKDLDIVMGEAASEATRHMVSWFREKRCALLIDDVWTRKISAQLFSKVSNLGCAGQQSTVVFTTREFEIASFAPRPNILRVTPREVTGNESRKILFYHAGMTVNDASDACTIRSVLEMLTICSGLPVSLAAAGKGVKMLAIDMESDDGDAWSEYLSLIRKQRELLLRKNVDDYGNLFLTFGASIALLEERKEEKLVFETPSTFGEMHGRFCVLEMQDKVPANMLRHLWQLKSEEEARIVGMRFVEVGLAESHYVQGWTHRSQSSARHKLGVKRFWRLGIHDSLHDFAIGVAKRQGEFVRAHEILVDGYCPFLPEVSSHEVGWMGTLQPLQEFRRLNFG